MEELKPHGERGREDELPAAPLAARRTAGRSTCAQAPRQSSVARPPERRVSAFWQTRRWADALSASRESLPLSPGRRLATAASLCGISGEHWKASSTDETGLDTPRDCGPRAWQRGIRVGPRRRAALSDFSCRPEPASASQFLAGWGFQASARRTEAAAALRNSSRWERRSWQWLQMQEQAAGCKTIRGLAGRGGGAARRRRAHGARAEPEPRIRQR
jgi:hypothetical protein